VRRWFEVPSHSNRIVSIINETALGFSSVASLASELRLFRIGVRVRVRVPDTRLRLGRSPYLFTYAV